jgi:Tfp pilus assembly protein PilP
MRHFLAILFLLMGSIALPQQPPSPPPVVNQAADGPNLIPQPEAPQAQKPKAQDVDKSIAKRIKDPFMIPNRLFLKLKQKLGDTKGDGFIDETVEPKKRWPLKYYTLVGIIWNVSNPKAMISDKNLVVHMFHVKDLIGNNEGHIAAIHNGEVVVMEKGIAVKLKIGK